MSFPEIRVLDRGFVRLIDHMGTDLTVVNAARVSFGKRKEAFEPKDAELVDYLAEHEHTAPFRHAYLTFHVKAPIFVFRQWMKHRIGCLTADTEVTFTNTNGQSVPRLRKTIGELWALWNTGQANGTAPCPEKIDEIRDRLANGDSAREIARLTGVDRATIRKIKEGRFSIHRSSRSRIRKMRLRVLNERENTFETGHIAGILDKGPQPVYRVTLVDGRTLSLTGNHRVLTSQGWMEFGEAVGLRHEDGMAPLMTRSCSLMSNGEEAHRNAEWLKAQRQAGRSLGQMAALAGCTTHTIRKWLRVHQLQFTNEETRFQSGLTPWNFGRAYKTGPRQLTGTHLHNIRLARTGSASNFWRGGVSTQRAKVAAWTVRQAEFLHAQNDNRCQACGLENRSLHAHHILPVWLEPARAMDPTNLASVCPDCHRKIHRNRDAELEFARVLLGNLPPELEQRPRRTGEHRLLAHAVEVAHLEFIGLQPTFDLCVEGPWHNFLANGCVVHNSDFNEISGRYVEFKEDEYFVPETFRLQAKVNKQGSEGEIPEADREEAREAYLEACRTSVAQYKKLIELGVCREQARCVLPVGLYSEVYWTVSLQAVAHFLHLRLDAHAQWEIRQFAQAVKELTEPLFPNSLKALMKAPMA